MRNNNRKQAFIKNFQNDKGENRKALRKNILNDNEWVQAFLQAQLDIRDLNSQILMKNIAF